MSRAQKDHPESSAESAPSNPSANRTMVASSVDLRIQLAISLFQTDPDAQVASIARSLNLSPSRFRHLFRERVGLSPGNYLRLVRLNRAKKLLTTTFLSVKEITARVGANDISHFVRDYKSYFGHTPTEERLRSAIPIKPNIKEDERKIS
jgi:transcriptional regulator GlxA family with amidase domain